LHHILIKIDFDSENSSKDYHHSVVRSEKMEESDTRIMPVSKFEIQIIDGPIHQVVVVPEICWMGEIGVVHRCVNLIIHGPSSFAFSTTLPEVFHFTFE